MVYAMVGVRLDDLGFYCYSRDFNGVVTEGAARFPRKATANDAAAALGSLHGCVVKQFSPTGPYYVTWVQPGTGATTQRFTNRREAHLCVTHFRGMGWEVELE